MNNNLNPRQLFDLTWSLALKEIKSRYKSTTLGFLWVLLNPLLQMFILTIVFTLFVRINIPNYPLFVFSGLLPWTYFSLALTSGTSSLINNRDIIKKVPFRREVLPISSVLANLLMFLVAIMLFSPVALFFNGLNINIFFFPILVVLQTTLISGLALLLSSLDIEYRDVSFLIQALLPVWFYLTPVFYSLNFVPTKFQLIYELNPMVGIITGYQAVFNNRTIDLTAIAIVAIESIIILYLGLAIFSRRSKLFADWI